ncbi:predicted protein [Botrytis cinerea T4]|uniref:Uncharacterized protein n=1 Tax=Botryotinia fuckeliana (strain T4) TaxID=999810 RepID=G2YS93_BOTF4|nr:predicted protein [Botrytis cinerea T4]
MIAFVDAKIHNLSGLNSQIDDAEQDGNVMNGVRANKSTVSSPNLIYESSIEHAKINCVSGKPCALYGSYGKSANDVPAPISYTLWQVESVFNDSNLSDHGYMWLVLAAGQDELT